MQRDVAAAQVALGPSRGSRWTGRLRSTGARGEADRGVIIGPGPVAGRRSPSTCPPSRRSYRPITGRYRVHTLALYPRNELLRDQLREAVSAALDVADVLRKSGRGNPHRRLVRCHPMGGQDSR